MGGGQSEVPAAANLGFCHKSVGLRLGFWQMNRLVDDGEKLLDSDGGADGGHDVNYKYVIRVVMDTINKTKEADWSLFSSVCYLMEWIQNAFEKCISLGHSTKKPNNTIGQCFLFNTSHVNHMGPIGALVVMLMELMVVILQNVVVVLGKFATEFFDRSIRALDICDAVRDGIKKIRLWHRHLEIVLSAFNSSRRI
ncbi:hypothetical protein M8C21_008559 [Ambrosia artemisiifolia]|uniref:Uncharacterized protein n=1 Tax=Ambrosia artemisiifolia TaxID=4212 RepID=A0AAD5BMR2_AMBAR|nr:hypothetical protein M8C21_008559 [Ambrosia artemisiifolia]